MDIEKARRRFEELRAHDGVLPVQAVAEVYDALEAVHYDNILGRWKGADIETGHFMARDARAARWYGKIFNSRWDARPLVCYDEDGNLYANTPLIGGAGASLWMVEFRGLVSAALVFDALPMVDHFRKVDDRTLMGVTDGRPELVLDNGEHSYFWLERD